MKVKGIAYYPEHWDEKEWHKDLLRIKEMGVNTIRIGEFMWSTLEPTEGNYDFTLLDKMVDVITSHGFDILLGTPTATFPVWIYKNYDDVMAVDSNGHKRKYGTRRQYCYNSESYLRLSKIITEKVVKRYKHHSKVIGIQIDNELGHEGSDFCQCENCKNAFREYLKDKYNDINELNEIHGNVFWGQSFLSFEDIEVPFGDLLDHNPSLRLEYARFLSRSLVSYANEMIKVTKRNKGDHQVVTTNLPGGLFNKWFDANDLVSDVDFVSFDNYPIWGGEVHNADDAKVAMELDMIRGLKEKKFWIVEELIGAQGHDLVGWLPRPNQAKLWAMQAHLRGAENIFFFRYKGMNKGEEQFCQGIFDVDDEVNEKFDEVKSFFSDVSNDFNTENLVMNNKVAILYDFDNIWSWKIQPQSSVYNFHQELMKHYRPLYDLNVNVDVISTHKDFNHYETIILPNMQIIDDELYKELENFLNEGKNIVFSYRSGIRNQFNNMRLGENIISEMIGGKIESYEALSGDNTLSINYNNSNYGLEVWRDIVRPITSKPLVKYTDYGFSDKACVTVNSYKSTQIYYIGASLDHDLLLELYKKILGVNEISCLEGIKLYSDKEHEFKLNHTFERCENVKPIDYIKK